MGVPISITSDVIGPWWLIGRTSIGGAQSAATLRNTILSKPARQPPHCQEQRS